MIHVILLGCVIVPLNSLLICILGDRILGFALNSEDAQVHLILFAQTIVRIGEFS